jgi:DNA-binding MarR family transcriptional regulator
MRSHAKPKATPKIDASRCSATLLRKASRRLSQLYDDALAPVGLTATQFALLVEMARRPEKPPTLTELAAAMVMDRSGLGHGLRPLERDGLIALKEGDPDRRRRHIVLTPKGNGVLRRAHLLWKKAEAHFVGVLGAADVAEFQSRLRAIAHDDRLTSPKKTWAADLGYAGLQEFDCFHLISPKGKAGTRLRQHRCICPYFVSKRSALPITCMLLNRCTLPICEWRESL